MGQTRGSGYLVLVYEESGTGQGLTDWSVWSVAGSAAAVPPGAAVPAGSSTAAGLVPLMPSVPHLPASMTQRVKG